MDENPTDRASEWATVADIRRGEERRYRARRSPSVLTHARQANVEAVQAIGIWRRSYANWPIPALRHELLPVIRGEAARAARSAQRAAACLP